MAYIMENVMLLKKGNLNGTSFLIDGNRMTHIYSTLSSAKYIKMNVDSFIMTAPHVMFKSDIPFHEKFHVQKDFYSRHFILKGSTAFLTFVELNYEHELHEKVYTMKKNLHNSPVDYVIGVKIPIRLLTVSLMRQCNKRKIPAIFIEIENADELSNVPWGWIKEAMFPYHASLIPIFKNQEDPSELQRSKMIWQKVTSKGKIPCLKDELSEDEPISLQNLAKVGILPHKGSIHHGSETSYNLYLKSEEDNGLNESVLYHQHEIGLIVTVHKGTVIRAGKDVKFQPGYGEYLKVIKPAFFSLE